MLLAYTKTLIFFEHQSQPFRLVAIVFEFRSSSSLKDFDPPQDQTQLGLRLPRFTRLLQRTPNQRLCDELNDTTGLLDLLLGITAEVTGTDDDGDLGKTALAEDLGVAEGQEVDDGGSVGLGASQVGVALLGGDEGPELQEKLN